jgi:hypothetical protein
VLTASAAAAFRPSAIRCPPASVVNAALGQKNKAPTFTVAAYTKTCIYKGVRAIPTKVEYQVDTPATFAAAEKADAALAVVRIKGLGEGAFAPKLGGFLHVYKGGGESIKILSPLTSLAKLEAPAHKLL